MSGYVIRRPKRAPAVQSVAASPVAERVEVPKIALTAEQERAVLVSTRSQRIHGEVIAEFRSHGAKTFNGDSMKSARDEYRCEEA